MPAWTQERKQATLEELQAVNAAIARALGAIGNGDTAEAADAILDAVAHKHHAIEHFPPIEVSNEVTVSAGALFRAWERKDQVVSQALAASGDTAGDHSEIIHALQAVIDRLLDLVTIGWRKHACAETLRSVEREVRALKGLLSAGVGQSTPAERSVWWRTVGRIRRLQAEFLDCVYNDASNGMSDVFLGLIDLDSRFASVLDTLSAWERQRDAGDPKAGDNGPALRNILDVARENKEEIERKIRDFTF